MQFRFICTTVVQCRPIETRLRCGLFCTTSNAGCGQRSRGGRSVVGLNLVLAGHSSFIAARRRCSYTSWRHRGWIGLMSIPRCINLFLPFDVAVGRRRNLRFIPGSRHYPFPLFHSHTCIVSNNLHNGSFIYSVASVRVDLETQIPSI